MLYVCVNISWEEMNKCLDWSFFEFVQFILDIIVLSLYFIESIVIIVDKWEYWCLISLYSTTGIRDDFAHWSKIVVKCVSGSWVGFAKFDEVRFGVMFFMLLKMNGLAIKA